MVPEVLYIGYFKEKEITQYSKNITCSQKGFSLVLVKNKEPVEGF